MEVELDYNRLSVIVSDYQNLRLKIKKLLPDRHEIFYLELDSEDEGVYAIHGTEFDIASGDLIETFISIEELKQ